MRSMHALACCALGLTFAVPALADGYLVDNRGNIIKSANSGYCIRNPSWKEGKADRDCLARAKKGAALATSK